MLRLLHVPVGARVLDVGAGSGWTTALLARLVGPIGLTVSRLASGLPVGGDLEYADEVTLGRAFEGRRTITA